MHFHFSKMHGLGNDFAVVDCLTQNLYFSADLVRRLADRHRGIGFDQLLVVEAPYDPEIDFHYRIYNADGSEVEQCGNGARCFALFVRMKGLTNKREIAVSTQKGKMILTIEHDDTVTVDMGEPQFDPHNIPFKATQKEKTYLLRVADKTLFSGAVSMGNPHCVTVVDDVERYDVEKYGSLVESHERFPERVNAGFMEIVSSSEIKLRVYERGAGETQACGSGACGAVAVGIFQGVLNKEVKVSLLGGELNIKWKGPGHSLFMTGSATHVYDGQLSI